MIFKNAYALVYSCSEIAIKLVFTKKTKLYSLMIPPTVWSKPADGRTDITYRNRGPVHRARLREYLVVMLR